MNYTYGSLSRVATERHVTTSTKTVSYLRDVLARIATTPVSQLASLTPRAWAAPRR